VHSEFARLTKSEPRIDGSLPVFLAQAYNLKSVANYETGPGSVVPPERAAVAIEAAQDFVDCVGRVLAGQ
jgi:hypothetical protein